MAIPAKVISRSPAELKVALEQHPFEVVEPRSIVRSPRPFDEEVLAKAREIEAGDDQWGSHRIRRIPSPPTARAAAELDLNKGLPPSRRAGHRAQPEHHPETDRPGGIRFGRFVGYRTSAINAIRNSAGVRIFTPPYSPTRQNSLSRVTKKIGIARIRRRQYEIVLPMAGDSMHLMGNVDEDRLPTHIDREEELEVRVRRSWNQAVRTVRAILPGAVRRRADRIPSPAIDARSQRRDRSRCQVMFCRSIARTLVSSRTTH